MLLCVPFANRCLIYSDWAFAKITLHSSIISQTGSPCADSPDRDSGFGIHLITAVSVIKKFSLYKFSL